MNPKPFNDYSPEDIIVYKVNHYCFLIILKDGILYDNPVIKKDLDKLNSYFCWYKFLNLAIKFKLGFLNVLITIFFLILLCP